MEPRRDNRQSTRFYQQKLITTLIQFAQKQLLHRNQLSLYSIAPTLTITVVIAMLFTHYSELIYIFIITTIAITIIITIISDTLNSRQ